MCIVACCSTLPSVAHQTFVQEALQAGIGPTINTVPDTIGYCVYNHHPHKILSNRIQTSI